MRSGTDIYSFMYTHMYFCLIFIQITRSPEPVKNNASKDYFKRAQNKELFTGNCCRLMITLAPTSWLQVYLSLDILSNLGRLSGRQVVYPRILSKLRRP
jgi:hypothetical protein